MAKQLQKENVGKDENGRYSEEFKQKIIKCIEKGMNSMSTAEELGIEPLGSGYRQLFYKLQREYSLGESIPTLKEKGLKPTERNKTDTANSTPKKVTAEAINVRPKAAIAEDKKLAFTSSKKAIDEDSEKPAKKVINEEQKNQVIEASENKIAEKPAKKITDKIKPIEESVEKPSKKGIKKFSEDVAELPKSNYIISSLEEMIKVREKEIQELRQMISELKKEG